MTCWRDRRGLPTLHGILSRGRSESGLPFHEREGVVLWDTTVQRKKRERERECVCVCGGGRSWTAGQDAASDAAILGYPLVSRLLARQPIARAFVDTGNGGITGGMG